MFFGEAVGRKAQLTQCSAGRSTPCRQHIKPSGHLGGQMGQIPIVPGSTRGQHGAGIKT